VGCSRLASTSGLMARLANCFVYWHSGQRPTQRASNAPEERTCDPIHDLHFPRNQSAPRHSVHDLSHDKVPTRERLTNHQIQGLSLPFSFTFPPVGFQEAGVSYTLWVYNCLTDTDDELMRFPFTSRQVVSALPQNRNARLWVRQLMPIRTVTFTDMHPQQRIVVDNDGDPSCLHHRTALTTGSATGAAEADAAAGAIGSRCAATIVWSCEYRAPSIASIPRPMRPQRKMSAMPYPIDP